MRTAELRVHDIAFGGKGVARENGEVVFVPYTIDGETVSAEITHQKKKFAEAQLIAIREPSPHRVAPQCPYFGRCGGCSYQHIVYEHQLAIKWRQVRDVLQRIGKLSDIPLRPIVPSPRPYAYRNRVTVHVESGVVGFFRRDSHSLIDVEHCPIAMDEVNRALNDLRSSRPREGHYTLRTDASAPRIFSQANDAVAHALHDLVMQMVPAGQKLLVDAFCGAGFFAKALLDKFERVIGIDWDRFAIEEARKNATAKEIYIAGDVEAELQEVGAVHPNRSSHATNIASGRSRSIAPTTLIVDPPSTGLSPNVRKAIVDLDPGSMVYVSCNPATLARDLADLQRTFKIESVTPLDMFPQTADIEVVVELRAKL